MRPRVSNLARARLLPVLLAIFAFNLGAAGWSAVVAGQLTLDGADTAVLGTLYAVCELSRLPAALLLPMLTLRLGARRITQAGLLVLLALPLIALTGTATPQVMLIFVLSALPTMAVDVAAGLAPVLGLFALGILTMLPVATFSALPPRTAWSGWSALAGRGLPW